MIERLNGESGHLADMLILVFTLGISSAILLPFFLGTLNKMRSLECLTALANAANQGLDREEASCPVPKLDVEKETLAGVERYFLSGSDERFLTFPVFLRTDGNLTFEQNFPRDGVERESTGRLKRGLDRLRVENVREGILIETESTLWGLVLELLVGLVLVLLIWGAIEWGGGCGLTLIVLVPSLFFLVVDLVRSESILIDLTGKQVRKQTTYLGVLELKPSVLTNPIALVPVRHHRANVMLLHRTEGELRATYLLDLDVDQLSGLASPEAALRGVEPVEPAVAEDALEGSVGEDGLPPKGAPEDQPGSRWSGVPGALGEALLHLGVLLVGSLLISIIAESIQGPGSFSLPLGNVLLVGVLGTGMSPFFGWTSTGIILAAYGIVRVAGALYERHQ